MFTLKITRNSDGELVPYDVHDYGGTDLLQIEAFKHLFPFGYCPVMYDELLFGLVRLHGWKVEFVETVKKKLKHN